MFVPFFENLRKAGVSVSLREYLTFLEAMKKGVAAYDVEAFYYLSRSAMVKDERNIDKFDHAFTATFNGLEEISFDQVLKAMELPPDWRTKMAEKHLSAEERAEIEAMGGFKKLMETLKDRLAEQKGRHYGGNKWIGTAGPVSLWHLWIQSRRCAHRQNESHHQKEIKIWDKREFKNFDDTVELGTRNIKVALNRLRRWARYSQ